jgi:hypothetical protein
VIGITQNRDNLTATNSRNPRFFEKTGSTDGTTGENAIANTGQSGSQYKHPMLIPRSESDEESDFAGRGEEDRGEQRFREKDLAEPARAYIPNFFTSSL